MTAAEPTTAAEPVALSRDELVELVLTATTDEITSELSPRVLRPNLLVEGCRHVRAFTALGYPDPDGAARFFAGRVADAVLDRLATTERQP